MNNPYEWLQAAIQQVPEILQPLIVAAVGAIPYLEGAGAAALGVVAGINPIVAAIAGAVGNILCVIGVVYLGARIRERVVARRAGKPGAVPVNPVPANPLPVSAVPVSAVPVSAVPASAVRANGLADADLAASNSPGASSRFTGSDDTGSPDAFLSGAVLSGAASFGDSSTGGGAVTTALSSTAAVAPERQADASTAKPTGHSKGRERLRRWMVRFGVPGASILAPIALPTMLTAAFFVGVGVPKRWVILWQVVAVVLWTAVVAGTTTGVIALLGW
jgi:hypothetical protein